MGEFLRQNSLWLTLGMLALFYAWIVVSSRVRSTKVDAFVSRSQADTEEFKRHNAAVEAKLDRIIALMEQQHHREA